MKIKTDYDIEDIQAASLHLYEHSKEARKMTNIYRIAFGIAAILSLLEGLHKRFLFHFIFAGIFLLFSMIMPYFSRWSIKNQVKENKKNFTNLGVHEHEIREDGIFTKTRVGEEMRYWKSIQRADYTDKGIFLWLGPNNILLIPCDKVIEKWE
jgi:hypothetical protein